MTSVREFGIYIDADDVVYVVFRSTPSVVTPAYTARHVPDTAWRYSSVATGLWHSHLV